MCKHICQLNELRKLRISSKAQSSRIISKSKTRGALAKRYNTRCSNRNIPQDFNQSVSNFDSNIPQAQVNEDNQLDPNILNSPLHNTSQAVQPTNENNQSFDIDYEKINRMIEANVTRILQNISIGPTNYNNNDQPNNLQSSIHPSQAQRPNSNHNNPYLLSPIANSNSNSSSVHADKITSVIQNWNIKFDGSSTGLQVEEFLYRIKSLTKDTFNGDFSVICRNLHILLTGKARDWYWRYHKQVDAINWNDFCNALRCQYKSYKSSFDIREEIRNRKQKLGETFDSFFDSILSIMDHLPIPMSDAELIEILARNLRPEIRQDLLYVPIHSISHLRKLVQMRENFLSDETVQKNLHVTRSPNSAFGRKYISEINATEEVNLDLNVDTDCSIEAIHSSEIKSKCWNCDEIGHHWENCLEKRSIFCYGCGTKNVYKPNCVKCAANKQQQSKNFRGIITKEKT